MKIGIFGGTFNPIHVAHVRMAQEYKEQLGLDRMLLVPTYLPPHKKMKGIADAEDRMTMCHLAVDDLEGFEVCDYEILQEGKSYTFKTLRYLETRYPDSEFYLIMGADMFLTVQDWRRPEEIYQRATLCAAERERGELSLLEAQKHSLEMHGARCIILDMEPTPLSSTMVRSGIRAGEDVSGLLHPAVKHYIETQKLYRK